MAPSGEMCNIPVMSEKKMDKIQNKYDESKVGDDRITSEYASLKTSVPKTKVPAKVMKMIRRELNEKIEEMDDETKVQMMKDTMDLFRQLADELPYVGAQVATILSERARWHVLGARFTDLAIQAGISTPHGMMLLDKALSMSARAENAGIKAYNLSIRLAEYESSKTETTVKTPWLDTDGEGDGS